MDKNILQMPERSRDNIPVSKGNRGNKKLQVQVLKSKQEPVSGRLEYGCTILYVFAYRKSKVGYILE
jgi:hypothetical protein